jgi:hypothetical protein
MKYVIVCKDNFFVEGLNFTKDIKYAKDFNSINSAFESLIYFYDIIYHKNYNYRFSFEEWYEEWSAITKQFEIKNKNIFLRREKLLLLNKVQ